jgi:hypothetical protein
VLCEHKQIYSFYMCKGWCAYAIHDQYFYICPVYCFG